MTLSTAINGSANGGGASARAAKVTNGSTGVVARIPTGLKAPLTVSRDSGSTSITFAASGNQLTASIASALAVGSSLSAIARVTQADGAGVLIPVTLTGVAAAPTLSALTLSTSSATVGTAATINIVGATAGSTITGTVPDGMTLNSGARTITGTPTTAGTYNFSLTETLAGATNTPRVSNVSVVVAEAGARMLFAASNQVITTSMGTIATGKTRFIGRSGHYISTKSAMKRLRVGFNSWALSESAPYEITNATSYTVSGVYVEYNGQSFPVTFGGLASLTVDSSQYMFWSDDIQPSLFGLAEFPAGAAIYFRYKGDGAVGARYPASSYVSSTQGVTPPSGCLFRVYDPANDIDQLSGTGAMTAPTGSSTHSSGSGFGMISAIIGEYSNPSAPAVFAHGDSIFAFGQGNVGMGWNNAANVYGGYTCAKIGAGMLGYSIANTFRKQLMQHANYAFMEDGTNDITAYSQTFSQIVTNMSQFISDARAAGIQKIIRPTLMTNVSDVYITALSYDSGTNKVTATIDDATTLVDGATYRIAVSGGTNWGMSSAAITRINATQFTYTPSAAPTGTPTYNANTYITDDHRSKSTQRPKTGWKAGEIRDQLHTQFADWLADGTVDSVPNQLALACDPNDNHYWKTDGTGGLLSGTQDLATVDGVHLSNSMQTLTGDNLRAAVAALEAGGTGSSAPTNLELPSIVGTAQEGQTLTASTGAWTGSPTGYTYQWYADGIAISGAVNSTRTIGSAQIGKVITVGVVASNASGSSAMAVSNPTSAVTAAPTPVPVNTVAPVISGSTTIGSTLSTTDGTWDNSPTGYTYQWRADGVNISGATSSTYVTVSGDAGKAITCRVTATNAGGSTQAVSSNSITPVASTGTSPGTVIVTNNLTNATTSNINIAATTYLADTGQRLNEAGDPDSVNVFGNNGNSNVGANNSRDILTSGAIVPQVYLATGMPDAYSVIVPWTLVTQPASTIPLGSWARGKQTTRGGYLGGLQSGTNIGGQRWRIWKGSDTTNAGSNATSAFLTMLAESAGSPNIAPGSRFVTDLRTFPQGNGDMLLQLWVDLKDGNGFVNVLEYTEPAANNPYTAAGVGGHYCNISGTSTTFIRVTADQQPVQIISR